MAEQLATTTTSLNGEEVIVHAVQYFTNGRWRAQSQAARIVTFIGRPKIPWGMLFLTVLAFMCMVVPGIIMYIVVIRKMYRFQNLVVTTTATRQGTEVAITHPKFAKSLVEQFIQTLPPVTVAAGV